MAKQTRRKYWKRKGRWSANIKTFTDDNFSVLPNGFSTLTSDLCLNPTQNINTVSQQYTVKNIELSFEIDYASSSSVLVNIESLTCYIVYIPQGYGVTDNTINQHPEWIMAYRFLGSPNTEVDSNTAYVNPGRNPVRVKSRMARRLQTGDKIVLLIQGYNSGSTALQLKLNGIVRWWTKAN